MVRYLLLIYDSNVDFVFLFCSWFWIKRFLSNLRDNIFCKLNYQKPFLVFNLNLTDTWKENELILMHLCQITYFEFLLYLRRVAHFTFNLVHLQCFSAIGLCFDSMFWFINVSIRFGFWILQTKCCFKNCWIHVWIGSLLHIDNARTTQNHNKTEPRRTHYFNLLHNITLLLSNEKTTTSQLNLYDQNLLNRNELGYWF